MLVLPRCQEGTLFLSFLYVVSSSVLVVTKNQENVSQSYSKWIHVWSTSVSTVPWQLTWWEPAIIEVPSWLNVILLFEADRRLMDYQQDSNLSWFYWYVYQMEWQWHLDSDLFEGFLRGIWREANFLIFKWLSVSAQARNLKVRQHLEILTACKCVTHHTPLLRDLLFSDRRGDGVQQDDQGSQ